MISLFYRVSKIGALGLLLMGALTMLAPAKTLDIPTTTAHLDLPGEWTVKNQNDMALYAVSEGTGKSVTVALFSNDNKQGVENPQFLANMSTVLRQRANTEGASVKIVNSGTTQLNGVPADFLQGELAFPEGGVAYARSYALAENGSILILTLMTRDPSEAADADLQAIAKTLHFDRPPVLPDENTWTRYHLGGTLLAFGVLAAFGGVIFLFLQAPRRHLDIK